MKKYVIVVPDGAADYPIAELGGKTIFEAAETPNLNSIAIGGMLGLSKTVPASLQPGSDVAMMAVLDMIRTNIIPAERRSKRLRKASRFRRAIGSSAAIL